MRWSVGPIVAIGTLLFLRLAWPGFFASGGGLFIAGAVSFLTGTSVAVVANPAGAWRHPAIVGASILLLLAAYIAVAQSVLIRSGAAQGGANLPHPGDDAGGGGGGGPLSPSVVATWEARFAEGAVPRAGDPSPPMTLDLLVLWRGGPGFDDAQISTTVGESSSAHRVRFRGREVELRFDRRTDTVSVGNHAVRLGGANVVLVDHADDPGRLLVGHTVRVDPVIRQPPEAGQPPWADVIRRSPVLFEYLRCDPRLVDSSDPRTAMRLRACAQLR